MLIFKEKMGSIYFMDEKTEEVRFEVTEPAVLLDTNFFTKLKLGNRDMVMAYYEESIQKCVDGNIDLFEDWVVMDLPKDVEVLNKINNNPGYLETFYQKVLSSLPKGE